MKTEQLFDINNWNYCGIGACNSKLYVCGDFYIKVTQAIQACLSFEHEMPEDEKFEIRIVGTKQAIQLPTEKLRQLGKQFVEKFNYDKSSPRFSASMMMTKGSLRERGWY